MQTALLTFVRFQTALRSALTLNHDERRIRFNDLVLAEGKKQMLSCYTDRLSVYPGERVTLFASASNGPSTLIVARVGRERRETFRREKLVIGDQPVPEHADRDGCAWPATCEFEIGVDWPSGYYDIVLIDAVGEETHHFVCVKPNKAGPRAKTAFVLSTNTYHSYNYWGGASAYADVVSLMTGRKELSQAMAGAIGVLSARRPFAQMLIAPPPDIPRLVNLRKRGFKEPPFASDITWPRLSEVSPYDGSAGFLHKWEHAFAVWAENENLTLDYFTDYDLDAEPDILDIYDVVVLVGHSEYWSARQRDCIENFVDRGGKLAIFSGNTAFWKVRWENDGATYVCHKWRGFEADALAKTTPSEGTHLWSHRAFVRPEAAITGLSFLFGGYHRLGLCAARGQAGYTLYNDRHWALAGSDLFYGDVIGGDIPFLGYENDGCRFQFGADGLPKPVPELGVPGNLEIIAVAPCTLGEDAASGYQPLIPPENLGIIARDVFEAPGEATEQRILRGHAVMASFRRGKGEVFNGGTTEWAHALKGGDPFITQITRNVLQRFGAYQSN